MGYSATFGSERDSDLSRYYTNVFWVMAFGVTLTAVIALWLSSSAGMMESLFRTYTYVEDGKTKTSFTASGWWWTASIIELLLVMVIGWGSLGKKLSVGGCLLFFVAYAALNGVTMSPVLWSYTRASSATVFFITAGMFAGCAFFGMVTRVNLLPLSGFFLMALVGLLIVLVVSIFMPSPVMDMWISGAAVLLFAGLTAFDMQKLREMYYETDEDGIPNLVMYGALTLYLDFINMYLHLLRLFGVKVPGIGGSDD